VGVAQAFVNILCSAIPIRAPTTPDTHKGSPYMFMTSPTPTPSRSRIRLGVGVVTSHVGRSLVGIRGE
jgi:hypothetical protein